jgi:hypothetical protein
MKSVARIRLVKTENPSACVTVNCNVYRSATACSPDLCDCIRCSKSNQSRLSTADYALFPVASATTAV